MPAIAPAVRQLTEDLLAFIDASPSPWHAVSRASAELDAAGFTALDESQRWTLTNGGSYYVSRGGSALIAFRLGRDPAAGLTLIGRARAGSFDLYTHPQRIRSA